MLTDSRSKRLCVYVLSSGLSVESVDSEDSGCECCEQVTPRLWVAWFAQSFLGVFTTMIFIFLIVWAMRYYNKLSPHHPVHLNPLNCGEIQFNVSERVVNGEDAKDMFPWTVVVAYSRGGTVYRHGTGALITPLHVLTAAHLVPNPSQLSNLVVLFGSSKVNEMQIKRVVGIRYVNTWMEPGFLSDDIMLFLLESPILNITVICVPPAHPFVERNDTFMDLPTGPHPTEGDLITVAGFGVLGESAPGKGNYDIPKTLIYTSEIVLADSSCYRVMRLDAKTEFCARAEATGICRGDSGSSAMLRVSTRMMSVGVASSTMFCGHSPDRFMKLTSYRDWLHTSVNRSPEDFYAL